MADSIRMSYKILDEKRRNLHQPELTDRHSLSGFTLLEIMIALAIIGITLTVVLQSVNFHADIMYENTVTTEMYQIAKEKMHELEMNPQSSKGRITGTNYTFESTALKPEESDIIELTTIVRGNDRQVVLNELVLHKIGAWK
jgi:prepilin-type N-terminal cleavage/methylation domain-containing protein